MSDIERLQLLTSQMHLETDADLQCAPLSPRDESAVRVSHAVLPNGKKIALLKTLLSSVCENNCHYCPFRSERDIRRASFKPDDFASLFMELHRVGLVEGIFLSSGVLGNGVWSQDQLLDTASLLRKKHRYRGYLHLKIMPGAEYDQVKEAMLLADRVSINLEAPNSTRLPLLAPRKRFQEQLMAPLAWMEEIRAQNSPHRAWNGRWPSSTTQFVVGGVGESDLELLSTTQYLLRRNRISRAYYSSFNPIMDTPLENQPPSPTAREVRLYQASFLLRDYGFCMEELPFNPSGDLPLDRDPKLAWADHHLRVNPVEINTASMEMLLRIPGIGPTSARMILAARRQRSLIDISQLYKLGISAERARPYILLNGSSPTQQMALF